MSLLACINVSGVGPNKAKTAAVAVPKAAVVLERNADDASTTTNAQRTVRSKVAKS